MTSVDRGCWKAKGMAAEEEGYGRRGRRWYVLAEVNKEGILVFFSGKVTAKEKSKVITTE